MRAANSGKTSGGHGIHDDGTSKIKPNNDAPEHNSTPTENLPGCGDPIDVATGRMFLTQTDVDLKAAFPLVVSRTHLSTYRSGRSFGPTWASTVDQRVEVDDTGVWFAAEDGSLLHYRQPDGDESVLPDTGPRWPLRTRESGGFTVTQPVSLF